MDRARVLLLAASILMTGGCKLFPNMAGPPRHFSPMACTVEERTIPMSVERTYFQAKTILKEADFTVTRNEMTGETAQIRADKDGRKFVLDLSSTGEKCLIHAEIDQPGSRGDLLPILAQLEASE